MIREAEIERARMEVRTSVATPLPVKFVMCPVRLLAFGSDVAVFR